MSADDYRDRMNVNDVRKLVVICTDCSANRMRMRKISLKVKGPQCNIPIKSPMNTQPGSKRLIEAINWNDEEAFLELLANNYNMNERDTDMMTPLHHALFNSNDNRLLVLKPGSEGAFCSSLDRERL